MAKIKLGPLVTDISGPIKNVSFSRVNRRTHVCKSRGCNISNPSSPQQATIRRLNQEASSIWRDTLTPTQRNNWDEYARGLKKKDGNPDPIRNLIPQNRGIMSGYHAFLGAWVQMNYVAVTPDANFNDAPIGQTPPSQVTGYSPTFVPAGIPNFQLTFDGNNEYVTLGDVLDWDFNQAQSWEFWICPQVLGPHSGVISKMPSDFDGGFRIYIFGAQIVFYMQRLPGAEGLRVARNIAGPGARKHIVITYDGSNDANGVRIYVDSVVGQVIQRNVPLTGSIVNSDPLRFAVTDFDLGTSLDGDMECIRNYNRVLTQPNVNTVFNAGAGLYSADPFTDGSCQGSWMFCQGFGDVLEDISGNDYDGDLINMEDVDWTPGLVPCPARAAHFLHRWTDPAVIAANSRMRIWMKTHQLGVHKQITTSQDVGLEWQRSFFARVSQGKHIPITDFPADYRFQMDVIQPNGLKSPPSAIAIVTVP